MRVLSVKVLSTVCLILAFSAAEAQNSGICQDVFAKPVMKIETGKEDLSRLKGLIRVVDSEKIQNFLDNLSNKYEVTRLQNLSPILDQGRRGFCHMYAMFAEMVREFKVRNEGKEPGITIQYWAYHFWLTRALETALDTKADLEIPEGSLYENTFDVVKKVGVFEEARWKALGGRMDINSAEREMIQKGPLKKIMHDSHRLLAYMDAFLKTDFPSDIEKKKYFAEIYMNNPPVVEEFKALVGKLKAKSKIQEAAHAKKNIDDKNLRRLEDLAAGRMILDRLSPDQINELKQQIKTHITEEVKEFFAQMFFDRKTAPQEITNVADSVALSEKLFPEMHQATLTFVARGDMKNVSGVQMYQKPVAGRDHVIFVAGLPDLERIVQSQVEDLGNSVWIGYEHNSYFVDNHSGVMSFPPWIQLKPYTSYIPRKERFSSPGASEGGHAVQVVGTVREKVSPEEAQQGKRGKILSYIIQNSWGPQAGQSGFYLMMTDFFRGEIFRVTIRDEQGEFMDSYRRHGIQQGQQTQGENQGSQKSKSNLNLKIKSARENSEPIMELTPDLLKSLFGKP